MSSIYHDRHEAGARLAAALRRFRGRADVVVLALPRGGVPVGYEVARGLGVPLDVFVVRKLGVPGHEELAMGAIASGGARVVNEEVARALGVSESVIEAATAREAREIGRRELAYRDGLPPPPVRGATVLLVDDGLATGSTMRAAVLSLRRLEPAWIVVAVPVGAIPTCAGLRELADEVICLASPEPFRAVGLWYEDFEQTTDDEVRDLLALAAQGEFRREPGARAVPPDAHAKGAHR